MLTQPIHERLAGCRRVLLAGAGGGYDILGAVPLLAALEARGVEVHLASLSFCYLNGLEGAAQDREHPNLYRVAGSAAVTTKYCPEAWLARFLDERRGGGPGGGPRVVWSFDKTGAAPLAAAYRTLVARLGVDAIVLIDGGIDAVLRGDETSLGTPSEDLATLAAISTLDEVPTRLLACVGLGAELRDGIAHVQVLERISELTRLGGYLGAASLVAGSGETDLYVDAVRAVVSGQADMKQSHVHKVITLAVAGEYGTPAPHVFLNPLLSLYWFFDAAVVARSHLFLPQLVDTESIWEVSARIEGIRKDLEIRTREPVPI